MAPVSIPKVSVIIPTFNRAHMVGRAIQSVLDQSFKDFEIIVVDDASSDNTEEQVGAIDDDRIKFVRHEVNRGGGAARNTGARLAEGEYLSFLDSDDEWKPAKLQKQLEVFCNNPHGLDNLGVVLTGRVRVVEETGTVTATKVNGYAGFLRDRVFQRQINGGYITLMSRREVFMDAGLFDEQLPACQDWDLLVRLSGICQFDSVDEVLYVAYIHGSGRVHSRGNTAEAYRILFEKYQEDFSRHREYHARLRANLSAWYLAENQKWKATQQALTAIKLCPWRIRPYAYIVLAALGSKVYMLAAGLNRKAQFSA